MIRTITRIIILSTVVLWIAYDIFVYLIYGNPATESAVIATISFYHPYIPFLAGLLCGHLFFDMREPLDWPKDETK
jgi:hypothetical protein